MCIRDSKVSITQSLLSSISIYPNPVQDKLNIQLEVVDKSYKVKILSVDGNEVLSKESVVPTGNTITMMANMLAGGVYIVELTDEKGNKARTKFIKH